MRKQDKYENSLITLRFIGEGFDQRGVNIYDLGNSLLAIQRIYNKAYLSQNDRLIKGAYPNKNEREQISLQIGERKRKSDAFALVPVLTDPDTLQYLVTLTQYVLSGMVGYYTGKVLDTIHKEKDNNKKIFIGSLHSELSKIVNRVDASGGVEAISIGSPLLGKETVAAFNNESKDYLSSLKNEYFLGTYQEIKGFVYKMYPSSNIVAIKRAGGSTVSIFLNEEDFEQIRYIQETKPYFLFKGHPRYLFGIESKSVNEFIADEISHITKDD